VYIQNPPQIGNSLYFSAVKPNYMKTHLKYFLLSLLVAPVFTACDTVNGSGNVVREERPVGEFSEVSVEGSMNVILTKGAGPKAVIEAEDNLMAYIELEERDNELVVRFRRNTNIRSHKPVRVHLSTNTLKEVDLSGSGNVDMKGLFSSEETMHIDLSGSGNVTGEVNAPEVEINISGSGNVTLKGETRDVDVNLAGSGNCRAEELLAENANVSIAGSGDVRIYASRNIKADIIGSGGVAYKGEPAVQLNKVGSGSVRKL
jgi:cytoskeletal protein CcmA (bactofilin family)